MMDEKQRDENRSEILYKLGAIEARLDLSSQNWVEPVRKIEQLLEKLDEKIDRDIVEVKMDVIRNKNDIQHLKTEFGVWKTRVSTVIATLSVAWLVFGDTVHTWLEKVLF